MKSLHSTIFDKISDLTKATESLEETSSLLRLKKSYQVNRLQSLSSIFQTENPEQALKLFFAQHFKQFNQSIFFLHSRPDTST